MHLKDFTLRLTGLVTPMEATLRIQVEAIMAN
jgi:hypothetical protein